MQRCVPVIVREVNVGPKIAQHLYGTNGHEAAEVPGTTTDTYSKKFFVPLQRRRVGGGLAFCICPVQDLWVAVVVEFCHSERGAVEVVLGWPRRVRVSERWLCLREYNEDRIPQRVLVLYA